MVALQRAFALTNDALAGKPSMTKHAKVLPVVRFSIISVCFFAHKGLAGNGEAGAAISLPKGRLLLRAWRFKGADAVTVSPVLARWSIFAYACPAFVGLTGISQLALNRIKLAVIVIPFQLHPFGGESFSGFFHSRRIEQRPLTRLEHPPRGRFASGSLSGAPTGRIRKEKPNGCAFGYLPDFGLAFISTLAGFVSVKIFLARNCDLRATYPDWRGARKRNLYTYPRRGHLIIRHARRLKAETRPKSHLVTI